MIIDIIVLAVLAISALIAFLRGFIRETLTILGALGAAIAAYTGGPILTPLIKNWLGVPDGKELETVPKLFDLIPYPLLATILAYGGIFIVVLITLSILSHVLSEGARKVGLGPVDRTLGVVFGLARGIILVGILFIPVHIGVPQEQKDEWLKGSQTRFYLEKVAQAIIDLIPDSAKDKMEETAGTAKETNDTREKLQSLDLLHQKEEPAPAAEEAPADPNNPNGYTEEFRDEMDRLFQQKTGQDVNP